MQTAGDMGGWHPHVHCLASRGGWTRAGEWVPVAHVDEHAAELIFRHRVMSLLKDEALLSEERIELLARCARGDSPPPAGGRRPAFPLSGRASPFLRPPRLRPRAAAGGEFLARVLMHVPEPRKHLVRYYGAYSELVGSSAMWPTAHRNGEPIGHALMTGSR